MMSRLRSLFVLLAVVALCSSAVLAKGGGGPGNNNPKPNPPKADPGGDANDPNAPPQPEPLPESSLQRLSDRLAKLGERLLELKQLADSDPREMSIRRYRDFKYADFKNKKRDPKAADLVAWMFEPDEKKTKKMAPFMLRKAALEALLAKKNSDPDLESGRNSPRAKLCKDKVVKHLKGGDTKTRKLAADLLDGLWRRPPEPAIINYNPRVKDTWAPAITAWKKFLKKK